MKNFSRLMFLMMMLTMGAISLNAQNWAGGEKNERFELRGHKKEVRDVKPMNRKNFGTFLKYIKNTSFDKNKLQMVEVATFGSYFSSAQCYEIISRFSFDDNKLEALKIVEPVLLDYDDKDKILRLFSYSSNRDKAAKILADRRR